MAKLAPFNKLPPRPEYLRKVQTVLRENFCCRAIEIEKKTRLTKTQVMCALEQLIKDDKVVVSKKNQRPVYSLRNKTDE